MAEDTIPEFYKDQTIFITGATGLLGKLIVRKILASCPDFKKIYILIREKRGKTPSERYDALLDSYAFRSLNLELSYLKNKITVIRGDCCLPDLGISQQDWQLLKNEVTCIIHSSATVRFDEALRTAAYSNVRSVQSVLKLAGEMESLKSVVYVSTAYSNCNVRDYIAERFYPAAMSAEELLQLVEEEGEEYLDLNIAKILGEWPNTYTYTKAIAENLIKESKLPVAIVRPSIIMGPAAEPAPGWIDTIQACMGISIGLYLSIVRCFRVNKEGEIALVPIDYVVNYTLAVARDVTKINCVRIYNFASSSTNRIKWKNWIDVGISSAKKYPSMHAVWWQVAVCTTNNAFYHFSRFWLHTAPAHLVDWTLKLVGRKPQFVKIYDKVHKGMALAEFFSMNSWNFEATNRDRLLETMCRKDKETFNFDMDNLDWGEYATSLALGARVHLLKDPLDTLPKARRRRVLFGIVHYTLLGFLVFLFFWVLKGIFLS